MKRLLLSFLLCYAAMAMQAGQQFIFEKILYIINDDSPTTVRTYHRPWSEAHEDFFNPYDPMTTITIPERVQDANGTEYTVTEIGDSTFFQCQRLATLTLPSTLKVIGVGAIRAGGLHNTVVLPQGLKTIKDGAFHGIPITSITIPGTVKNLGNGLFNWCNRLRDVVIEEGVPYLPQMIFNHCYAMHKIHIPSTVKSLGFEAFSSCGLDTLVIPATVEYVGRNLCYDDSTSLKAVIFEEPSAVHTTDAGAFMNCKALKEVVLPSNLKTIGDNAFINCTGITAPVEIPAKVSSIGVRAFYNCKNMSGLTLNEGLTSLGDSAFQNCYRIPVVKIPTTLTTIPRNAFKHCKDLEYLWLPAATTSLGHGAFNTCPALRHIWCQAMVPPTAPDDVFMINTAIQDDFDAYSVYDNAYLHVYPTVMDDYKTSTQDWRLFKYPIATGIEDASDSAASPAVVGSFDITGRPVGDDYVGMVIMRYSDGTAKKVMRQ